MSDYDSWAAHLDPDGDESVLEGHEREALYRIGAALADEAMWANPPTDLRARILARVAADTASSVVDVTSAATPAALKARSRWWLPALAAVVTAAVVLIAVAWPRESLESFDLAGTDLNPEAHATVEVEPLGAGVALTLHITGIPPAGDGQYYAGWLIGNDGVVPVGSFHWRKGGIPIELWSGVDTARYPTLLVTLQEEGEPTVLSGLVVLTGRISDS